MLKNSVLVITLLLTLTTVYAGNDAGYYEDMPIKLQINGEFINLEIQIKLVDGTAYAQTDILAEKLQIDLDY